MAGVSSTTDQNLCVGPSISAVPASALFRAPGPLRPERLISAGFSRAMRLTQLAGVALVQTLLLWAALSSPLFVPALWAPLVAGGVLLTAVLALTTRLPDVVLVVAHFAALTFYFVVAVSPDGPLITALLPLTAWTITMPMMLRRGAGPLGVSVALAAWFAALIAVAHPGWDHSVMWSSVALNLILIVNVAGFGAFLRRFAAGLDREKSAAIADERRSVRRQVALAKTAEWVRVLHDTIMNTFGALARALPPGTPVDEVRERCRYDMAQLAMFNRSTMRDSETPLSLTDLDRVGFPLVWGGMSGEDLRRFQALLPPPVLEAMYGCASEAILNAAKHSGADHVNVRVSNRHGTFEVTIADDGCGFDRAHVTERGIAESLIARGEAQKITIAIDSVVGKGTVVSLAYDLNAPTVSPIPTRTPRPLGRFTRQMTFAWALHAIAIGVCLEAINPHENRPGLALLTGLLALTGTVWASARGDRRPSRWVLALLYVAIPISSGLAVTSAAHRADSFALAQAIALTVLPVLVYAVRPTFPAFFAAVALQAVSEFLLGAGLMGTSDGALGAILLLEAPTVALLAAWSVMLRKLRSTEAEIAEAYATRERAMREAAARQAASDIAAQWSAHGLERSLSLLRDIADGRIPHNSPETRARCAAEELFLRQMSMLAHTPLLMNRWFALSIAEAQRRDVRFKLHAGSAVVDDPEVADQLGRFMLACVAASEAGDTISAALVGTGHGSTRLTVVAQGSASEPGPNLRFADRVASDKHDRLQIETSLLRSCVIVDATWVPSGVAPAQRSALLDRELALRRKSPRTQAGGF